MTIYNVTIKADLDIQVDFMDWVRQFTGDSVGGSQMPSRIFRLLGVDATDGITYCLQHYFTDTAALNAYRADGEMAFREEMADRFGDKLVVFSSVLAEV